MGDWLDAESLRHVIIGAMVVLAVVAAFVIKAVRRLLLQVVLVVITMALAVSLWLQRADLGDCAATCSCSLYGLDVTVPASANPNCS